MLDYLNFVFWFIGIAVIFITALVIVSELVLVIKDAIVTFINHCVRWNIWRKKNNRSWKYKFHVFVGLVHSPSFDLTLTKEESKNVIDAVEEAVKNGKE